MPEDGVEHELVAERLLRLAGDGRDQPAALDDVGEPAPLLGLRAEGVDEAGDLLCMLKVSAVAEQPAPSRAARARRRWGRRRRRRSAGHGERQQTRRVKVAVVLVRKRGLGVVAGGARCEARARQLGHARNELGLVAGQRAAAARPYRETIAHHNARTAAATLTLPKAPC